MCELSKQTLKILQRNFWKSKKMLKFPDKSTITLKKILRTKNVLLFAKEKNENCYFFI